MSLGVRLGPFRVNTRGRVGVSAGPFYAYGGGRGRRGGGGGWLLVIAAAVIATTIVYWYIALPVAIVSVVVVYWARRSGHRRRAEAVQRWLSMPAPPLMVPSRFTQNWIAANVPQLHPGQVPVLVRELRARGWTDERIDERVGPYLAANPYMGKE